MAETDSDIARSASSSYNPSAYEGYNWPCTVNRPKYTDDYPPGLLGPECLLVGLYAGSSYQHLHTQGAFDAWQASNGH